jgi:hypothetical protein
MLHACVLARDFVPARCAVVLVVRACTCTALHASPPHALAAAAVLSFVLQVSISRVFAAMAGSRAAELGVLDWAVANATMEHAFIRITQQMQLTAAE